MERGNIPAEYPGKHMQPLFDYLSGLCEIPPTLSEMEELINVVEKTIGYRALRARAEKLEQGIEYAKIRLKALLPADEKQFAFIFEKVTEALEQQPAEQPTIPQQAGMPKLDEPLISDAEFQAWEQDNRELSPEQITQRKEAIEWYRNPEKQQGAVWVKADTKPEHNVGVLVFIPGEDNHITSGMWDIDNKWVLLDEYRVPECEVTYWMALPGLPEGVEHNDLPDEIGKVIREIAKKELRLDEGREKEVKP